MRFDGTGDLHGRQHHAAGRMHDEIDRALRRGLLDGGNDGLGVFEVDMAGEGEAGQAELLLAMDYGDETDAALPVEGLDGLDTVDGVDWCAQQGLRGRE